MYTVLLLGGAGYIGAHTAKRLAALGIRPVVVDSLHAGSASFVRWGPLEVADIRDTGRLQSIIATYEPSSIMHFASLTSVADSNQNPRDYFDVNVTGTLSCAEAIRRSGRSISIIFSSTAAVYGSNYSGPIPEDAPLQPSNIYGCTKLICEQLIQQYHAQYGIPYAILRYFNAAGADIDGEIGESHDPETHLIPRIVQSAINNECTLTINGTDYPTPDGTCIRDYVHVSDLAIAHTMAFRYLESGGPPGIFNIGTGNGYSVREIILGVERLVGRSIPLHFGARRSGDAPILIASPVRAQNTLGFRATQSDLPSLLTTAFRWHTIQAQQQILSSTPSQVALLRTA